MKTQTAIVTRKISIASKLEWDTEPETTLAHQFQSLPEGAGALLFFGYFDQTDVFFKMARVLSMNTRQLDNALERKLQDDVAPFNPPSQLRAEQYSRTILEQP